MTLSRPEIHLDDQLSLAEFVALWWAVEAPEAEGVEASENFKKFLDRKQASVRMLRLNRPGFPSTVGSNPRSGLYRLGDLVSWIVGDNGDGTDALEQLVARLSRVPPLWHLRRAVDACQRQLDAESSRSLAVAAILALHCLGLRPGLERQPPATRRLTSVGHDTIAQLRIGAQTIEKSDPELEGVFERLLDGIPDRVEGAGRLVTAAADAIVSGADAAGLVDLVLGSFAPARTADGGSTLTETGLSRLMIAAGDPQPGEGILDLAAGEGSLLLCAAEESGDSAHLAGFEPDPLAWAIAKSRFYLHGLTVDLTLGKSLGGSVHPGRADLVLVDPPLKSRLTFRKWLSLASDCTGPGGRAVVVLPAVTLSKTRREWREFGPEQVGIIVKSPNRLRRDLGDALALWVLDDKPEEQILLVDASNLSQRQETLNLVGSHEADSLRHTIRTWRKEGRAEVTAPVVAQAVSRPEEDPSSSGHPVMAVVDSKSFTDIDEYADFITARSKSRELEADLFGGNQFAAGTSDVVEKAVSEAKELAERLGVLVNGPLRPYSSEEQRRALSRLVGRLEKLGGLPS
jgi:hypothetical protein